MIETQFAHSDPPVYSVRRDPILVCPHCKRAVDDPVSLKSANTVFSGICKEHGDVVAIWSEVVNAY